MISSRSALHYFTALVVATPWALGQNSKPDQSVAHDRAVQLVQEYIATEPTSAGDRVRLRKPMLEFDFQSVGENGRYRTVTERKWADWEADRALGGAPQEVKLLGEPQVEVLRKSLLRITCAVHLKREVKGEMWEGVSIRSFEVRVTNPEEPRIRSEQLHTEREGIRPGKWKRVMKKDNGTASNLRASATATKRNIMGKVANGEIIHIWDQTEHRWVLAQTAAGAVGFIHRGQLDFEAKLPSDLTAEKKIATQIRKQKNHPFAVGLPGKPGFVLNPYTNTVVDVRGLRAGTLVRDPDDKVKRAFRVPFSTTPSRALVVDE